MPFDPGHLLARLLEPFNSESRFYWPFVIGLGVALVAHIVWYSWRMSRDTPPAESTLRGWAFWINVLTLVWSTVLVIAKVPFLGIVITFALDFAALVYMYAFWLPPREAAWVREKRRQRYFPQPKRRRR